MNIRQNSELRQYLATANQLVQFQAVVQQVRAKYEPFHKGEVPYEPEQMAAGSEEDVSCSNGSL